MIQHHNHSICIEEALLQANLICNQRNLRFTDLRQKVFSIILQNHQPIKAYDVLSQLQKEDSAAKPSTVYRSLDFLLENGLVHKLHSLNSYAACTHPSKHNKCYFLICEKCLQIEECCTKDLAQSIENAALASKFKIKNMAIEISGLCAACSSAA